MGRSPLPTRRIRQLAAGVELLRLFLVTATADLVTTLWFFCLLTPWAGVDGIVWLGITAHVLLVVAVEAAVFWAGMIRVYITSVQLGLEGTASGRPVRLDPAGQHLVSLQDHPHRL